MATKFQNVSFQYYQTKNLYRLTMCVQAYTLLSSCNHVPLCVTIFILNCPHAYYTNYSCIEIKTIKIKTLSRHMALVCKLGQNKQLQHQLRSKRLYNNIWMKLLTWVKWSKSVINFTMHYHTLSFINVHIFVCVT